MPSIVPETPALPLSGLGSNRSPQGIAVEPIFSYSVLIQLIVFNLNVGLGSYCF